MRAGATVEIRNILQRQRRRYSVRRKREKRRIEVDVERDREIEVNVELYRSRGEAILIMFLGVMETPSNVQSVLRGCCY